MTFAATQRLATLLAAAAAFLAVAVGGNLHPLFIAAFVGALLGAWWVPAGRLPGRWIPAITLLAAPLVVVLVLRGLDMVTAATYFASGLLALRLLTHEGYESHAQAHLLSVLVLAGGAAISPDVTYLVAFVLFVFALTWALVLNHLEREAGAAARALPTREVVGPGLSTGVFALTTAALLATAATFFFFPRTTFGLGLRRPLGGASVGLSDRIELAGFGRLKDDDRVVLRVWPRDGEAGELERTYWRAHVLERYDGRGWTSVERPLEDPSASNAVQLRAGQGSARQLLDVEVVTDPGSSIVPVPDRALSVQLALRDARGSPTAARKVGPSEVRTVGDLAEPYRMTVAVERIRLAVDDRPPIPEEVLVPELDFRMVALANRLAAEARGDPAGFADRLERYLSSSYGYTTDLPGADASVEHFLFDRREGHCEYFATAMAVLLRLEHVPARVVTGFYGATWNDSGGYWAVRQGTAHAWVEVWREGTGWIRYDPTPPIGRGTAARIGLGERLSDAWDALQARWSQWVLDYDLRTQWRFVQSLRRSLRELGDQFSGSGARLPLARGLLVMLALLVVAGLLLRLRPRLPKGQRLSPSVRRARRVHKELLRTLAHAGRRPAPALTTEELVAEARQAWGEGPALRRIEGVVGRYEAVRFGGSPLEAGEARALRKALRGVRKDLPRAA